MVRLKLLLEPLLISIISIFSPIQSTLVATAALILVDLVTGIMASRKKGEPITSAGLRRTVSKMFVYELAIMLAYVAETYMGGGLIPMMKMASTMVAIVELKSCYENLNVIGGNEILKSLIDKLGSTNQDK